MKHALVTLLLSSVALSSVAGCWSAASYEVGSTSEAPTVTTVGACSPSPCLKLSISKLPPLADAVSPPAREAIYREVAQVAYAPFGEGDLRARRTAEELKDSLQEMFTEVVDSGVSDAPTEWQLERLISIPHATTDFITVDIRNRGYVGGAHGFDERWLLVFKARDGSKVTLEQLVGKKSLSLLSTISEAELRRVRNIPSNQSLQDAGFFLPAGSSLPLENFGLFEQGLVVRFNPYEIAPYVVGATEITLPNEAISPLIASANQSGPSEVLQAVSEPAPVVTPATAEVS